ncbi:MAG: putative colanic acid biosynthesis acetyltransferase [Arenicella sp.]|jgi:putative colanic acid biosynthesis acetyltransferase WcaF|nr:putative colanic acid biosynthesis acetyltransferase [Arenicella sp.]
MYQHLEKFRLPDGFRGRSAIIVQTWWLVQSTLFGCSPQFMYGWRNFLLRLFGAEIGKGVIIRPSVRVTNPWNLTIGDHSWVGDHAELYTLGDITIGRNVVISQKTYLCTGSHDYEKIAFDIYAKPIIVEDEVWLGTDVFVAPGVIVHKGAVVGARSTVLDDILEGMICVGCPAKPIKKRKTRE